MAITNLALPSARSDRGRLERPIGRHAVADQLQAPAHAALDADQAGVLLGKLRGAYRHLHVRFEPDIQALWCYQQHPRRPCFSPGLLNDVLDLQLTLKDGMAGMRSDELPVKYLIWASSLPGIYNLGGDLGLFCELIRARDVDGLRAYAQACIDICYLNGTSLDLPLLTVALVQGDALGGGFESVLSNDLIIAEQGAKLGLPEVVFNLFPGMGAYSFLSRRLDASRARAMIVSGRLYAAEELHEMGVVDQVVPAGSGAEEMRRFIDQNARRRGMLTALAKVDRRCQPISYDELIDVADIWVETALGLGDDDLRRMERLMVAQDRRRLRAEAQLV